MELPEQPRRRTVLQRLGAGVAASAALAGPAAGSPRNNFGYAETDSQLVGETVTLSGRRGREKVFCDAGESESRIKTVVWEVAESDEALYLIPSGYEGGDVVTVGSVFTRCTRNDGVEGEVTVTRE
jgi:hypothetical protein